MKKVKDYTTAHTSNGKFAVGNPGGGRPVGSQNLTNLPRIHKEIGKRRGDLQLLMQDALEENMPMIVKNLIQLCEEKNERVLLALLGSIYPKMKDFDIDKFQDNEGKSIPELKDDVTRLLMVYQHKLEEEKVNEAIL